MTMSLPSPPHALAVAVAPVVHVIDDDVEIANSLVYLLQSVGIVALTYPDAASFLAEFDPDEPAVVILEVRLRGQSGLQIQQELAARDVPAPVIFCSAHGDVAMAVRAMAAGAVDFLEKPYDPQQMLETVQMQLPRAGAAFAERDGRRHVIDLVACLTPREREVLRHVIDGLPSQVIASRLGTSVKTVDVHRARIRAKTGASSLATLVRDVLVHRVAV